MIWNLKQQEKSWQTFFQIAEQISLEKIKALFL